MTKRELSTTMTTQTASFQQVATAASALTPEEQAMLLDILKENISDYLAQRRRSQAWELARTAAKLLREKFGATRVVVFGALFSSKGLKSMELRCDSKTSGTGVLLRDW